jgi:hypothetical protein
MAKITYTNKAYINQNADIPVANKVTDDDMNEIKSVVNTNDDDTTNKINEFYYQANDTFEIDSSVDTAAAVCYQLVGVVTAGQKSIRFTIPVPKSLKNISSVTIDNLTLTIRGVGGYIQTSGFNYLPYVTTIVIIDEHNIGLYLNTTGTWSGSTNNTPVSISAESGHIKLTFN